LVNLIDSDFLYSYKLEPTLLYNNLFVDAGVSDLPYFYLDLDRIQPKMDPECGLGSGFESRNLQNKIKILGGFGCGSETLVSIYTILK
jgi:hypothetical protein